MSVPVYISYVTLCVIVIVQSSVLYVVLQDTLWLKRLYDQEESGDGLDSNGPELGSELPAFRGQLLDSTDVVTDRDLRGDRAILLFVSARRALDRRPGVLQSIVYALWNKIDGYLHIVCDGTQDDCRLFRDSHELHDYYGDSVRLVVDEDAALTKLFSIASTPSAVMFDENGYVSKVGKLSADQSPATGNTQPAAAT